MRILLISMNNGFNDDVLKLLNPENEYCAFVVDNVEATRALLSPLGYPAEKIFPFYELQDCVKNFYFDCVLCFGAGELTLPDEVKRCGVPRNKFIHLYGINSGYNFLLNRALDYYKKNFKQFKIFATGMSYSQHVFLPEVFTKKLFNFCIPSQDLYYDYKIAKSVISTGGGVKTCTYRTCTIFFSL